MASSDVIELGSSDDEAEPVPKKKKPALNAMVHFPNDVPGLVIKPIKPALPQLQKVLAGGAVTITNVKQVKVNKPKTNVRSVQKFVPKTQIKHPMVKNILKNPIPVNNMSVNPLNLMIKHQHIKVHGPKLNLPPGITVKRAANTQNNLINVSSSRRKQALKRKEPEKAITTVELDDEEVPLTSGTGPQWYLRPEEQTEKPVEKKDDKSESTKKDDYVEKNVSMELENNREPETTSYIEITIEDSPIKPLQVKKGFEIGTELPITIEDSPIKLIKSVKEKPCVSEDDDNSDIIEPQSKKKLDYPNGEDSASTAINVVEIDLEIIPSNDEQKEKCLEVTVADTANETAKDIEIQKVDIPRRVQTLQTTKEVEDEEKSCKQNIEQKSASGEFHPVYQKFIDLCFELENSDDMSKIVEKKIRTYYRQCPKDYVESEEFIDMVSSKIYAMKAAPDRMYLFIKDIVDDLNLQRKTAKAVDITKKENKKTDDDKYSVTEGSEYDSKRRRQIRKLDKTIKKLHRAIQKLEEQEVEFEDEEDSVYLLTERYKERLIRVHAKFCQLTNTKMPSEPRIQIEARPGYPTGPAKRLEKWINKKVPIGTPLPFPDFHDVLRCVRDANDEDRLGWNEADIMEEARDLFTRCGKKLQRRRQENEWRIAAARISHDASTLDPAEKSDELKKKLEENKALSAKRETELLNKYADKQNQLRLVGEEIGDKEAEESPVESEDDEGNDESDSLEDKRKRKDRLKRLLHENTRKMSTEKENVLTTEKDEKAENEVADVSKKTDSKNPDILEDINGKEVIANDTTSIATVDGNGDATVSTQLQVKPNDSDVYDFDSDIDELHLLQKFYSKNENNSSTQESDSDTPIAISDTLDSDSDNGNVKILQSADIISIENSSYSESEATKDECESAKTSEVVKNNKIDCVVLGNTEVLLPSSTSADKKVDNENILLVLSEEESNVDTHLHSEKTEVENCDISSVFNDSSADNDCEVILSNCNENSLENHIESYEVPLNEKEIDNVKERITSNNLENRALDNLNEIESNQSKKLGHEDSSNLVSIEDQDYVEPAKSSGEDIITNEVTSKVQNDFVTDESDFENVIKTNCDIDNSKCREVYDNNKSLRDENILDEVELKITATKEKISESRKDNFEADLCPESNVIDGNDKGASESVKTICTERDDNECEGMDVNVEIAEDNSSLTNPQTTCEDVEVATSVQCK